MYFLMASAPSAICITRNLDCKRTGGLSGRGAFASALAIRTYGEFVEFFKLRGNVNAACMIKYAPSDKNFKIRRFSCIWFHSIENLFLTRSRSNTTKLADSKSHNRQQKVSHFCGRPKTLNWSRPTKN